jgi:hypothetical protein
VLEIGLLGFTTLAIALFALVALAVRSCSGIDLPALGIAASADGALEVLLPSCYSGAVSFISVEVESKKSRAVAETFWETKSVGPPQRISTFVIGVAPPGFRDTHPVQRDDPLGARSEIVRIVVFDGPVASTSELRGPAVFVSQFEGTDLRRLQLRAERRGRTTVGAKGSCT